MVVVMVYCLCVRVFMIVVVDYIFVYFWICFFCLLLCDGVVVCVGVVMGVLCVEGVCDCVWWVLVVFCVMLFVVMFEVDGCLVMLDEVVVVVVVLLCVSW